MVTLVGSSNEEVVVLCSAELVVDVLTMFLSTTRMVTWNDEENPRDECRLLLVSWIYLFCGHLQG